MTKVSVKFHLYNPCAVSVSCNVFVQTLVQKVFVSNEELNSQIEKSNPTVTFVSVTKQLLIELTVFSLLNVFS